MMEEGRVEDVCAYGEGDVLNLFCMYVRWAFLSGRTDAAGHNASMRSLAECLGRELPPARTSGTSSTGGRPHRAETP